MLDFTCNAGTTKVSVNPNAVSYVENAGEDTNLHFPGCVLRIDQTFEDVRKALLLRVALDAERHAR